MRSLKEILSRQKPVHWVESPTNPGNAAQPTHAIATVTDVTTDADTCKLSFKEGRVFQDQHWESVQTWRLNVSDIDQVRVESLVGFVERLRAEGRQPGWETQTTPAVFVLELLAAPNHKFDVHRWSKNSANEVSERDLQQSLAFIVFASEASANEAAKTVRRVQTSCAPVRSR